MSNNALNPNQDDVRLLAKELGEVKDILRELSQELFRIERRVKAAFPAMMTPNGSGRSRSTNAVKLDEESAQRVIATLKDRVSKGEQIETDLRQYSVKPGLQILAKMLGMTNTKLPPKDELVRRISTRLRQSVSVTTGIHEAAGGSNNRSKVS